MLNYILAIYIYFEKSLFRYLFWLVHFFGLGHLFSVWYYFCSLYGLYVNTPLDKYVPSATFDHASASLKRLLLNNIQNIKFLFLWINIFTVFNALPLFFIFCCTSTCILNLKDLSGRHKNVPFPWNTYCRTSIETLVKLPGKRIQKASVCRSSLLRFTLWLLLHGSICSDSIKMAFWLID